MSLTAKKTESSGLAIYDDQEQIAEISGLKLTSARFRPGGRALICDTVPLFLFWMQYANHQDPERNASAGATIEIIGQSPDQVILLCSGTTASGACSSAFVLTIQKVQDPIRYMYSVAATLDVVSEKGWLVTPNPTQGEVEFANLWPEGTFSPNRSVPKRYQACYVATAAGIERIRHHHLETSDKHNIVMQRGDRFLWLLEEENLCLTLTSENALTAGVCAYMWDAHFAYKVCADGTDVLLPVGTHLEATYELNSLLKDETISIVDSAKDRPAPELPMIPLYNDGVNHFRRTLQHATEDWRFIWPWEAEGDAVSTPTFDLAYGFDDSSCLRIDSTGGKGCWKVTTLGPAFGGKPFVDGVQYRLSAIVKTSKLRGKATIALRFHRQDKGSIFNINDYEIFTSSQYLIGDSDWKLLNVMTPPISPAPDRFHILLIQDGSGTTWFDDVHFEVLE